jgi:tetratricopeptide (TPR) repeat protein
LLISFSALRIPFYVAGLRHFSNKAGASKTLLQVVNKFLVLLQDRLTGTYLLHDLIRNHINSFLTVQQTAEIRLKAVEYLESIEFKKMSEWVELVGLSLEIDNESKDRSAAHSFLAKLLAAGYFQMASDTANNLLRNERAQNWDFVYLVIGRVSRLQGDYQAAMYMYEKALTITDGKLKNVLTLELAAVVFNLSHLKKDKSLFEQSMALYDQMIRSGDPESEAAALGSLGAIKVRTDRYDEAITDLELALEKLKMVEEPEKSIASVYQTLGDSYSKKKDYQKALSYYRLSLTEYEQVVQKWGMNTFEGLYYLYSGMGWTYSKMESHHESAAHFLMAYDLAKKYEVPKKFEQAFFDYSYNLLLAGNFDAAADKLFEHYEMISNSGNLKNWDPNLILGALMFANWYAGRVTMALAFMGGLINYMAFKKRPNPITIIAEDDIDGDPGALDFFKKQIYVLILDKAYTFDDLRQWIAETIDNRPELKNALGSFLF